MRLTFEAFNRKLDINLKDDLTAEDLLEELLIVFSVATYHPNSIKNAIIDLAEEYKDMELYEQRKDSPTMDFDEVVDKLNDNKTNIPYYSCDEENCESCSCCENACDKSNVKVTDYSTKDVDCKEFKFSTHH